MNRRRLLILGAGSAALLGLGGALLLKSEQPWAGGKFSPTASGVWRSLSTAFLDGSLPKDASLLAKDLAALNHRLEVAVSALPQHAQAELSQLLALMASAPGRRLLVGLNADWESASVSEVQQALESMRGSRLDLRQQAYLALHDLVGAAYFSDPSTWTVLGYPGPVNL